MVTLQQVCLKCCCWLMRAGQPNFCQCAVTTFYARIWAQKTFHRCHHYGICVESLLSTLSITHSLSLAHKCFLRMSRYLDPIGPGILVFHYAFFSIQWIRIVPIVGNIHDKLNHPKILEFYYYQDCPPEFKKQKFRLDGNTAQSRWACNSYNT